MVTQYETDANLAARQRLWAISERSVDFELYAWVLQWVEGDDVLDVGCGNGVYLALLDGAVGMDLSPGMLASAGDRTSSPLVCADAQRIPFVDHSFDTVLAPHMLYHVPDIELAAREMRRVLRAGGACIAVTNGADTHRSLKELVEDVVGTGWRWKRPSSDAFSMENGAAKLRAGFESVETVYAPDVVFSVTDADALADYVGSIADIYEEAAGVSWADVVDECRQRAATIIDRDGAFKIEATVGAFVCR